MSLSSRTILEHARLALPAITLLSALGIAAMAGVACKDNSAHTSIAVDNSDCVTCHRDEYERATAPIHVSQLPLNCEGCHSYDAWNPARGSDHDSYFPLTFTHAKLGCGTCHTNGFESGATPSKCYDCHQDDYQGAKNPPHDGFSKDCSSCHTPAGWTFSGDGGGGFVHPWPLIGHHATAACTGCHVGNPPVYAGTPKDCVACHQADYDSSPYPGHDTFPTDCTSCHTTTAWKPASGGHPENLFPITGRHNYPCADCHNSALGPNGKDNTDCVGCHTGAHTRSRMDSEHSDVNNYPTGSAPANFCLDCHPRG